MTVKYFEEPTKSSGEDSMVLYLIPIILIMCWNAGFFDGHNSTSEQQTQPHWSEELCMVKHNDAKKCGHESKYTPPPISNFQKLVNTIKHLSAPVLDVIDPVAAPFIKVAKEIAEIGEIGLDAAKKAYEEAKEFWDDWLDDDG